MNGKLFYEQWVSLCLNNSWPKKNIYLFSTPTVFNRQTYYPVVSRTMAEFLIINTCFGLPRFINIPIESNFCIEYIATYNHIVTNISSAFTSHEAFKGIKFWIMCNFCKINFFTYFFLFFFSNEILTTLFVVELVNSFLSFIWRISLISLKL